MDKLALTRAQARQAFETAATALDAADEADGSP